MISIVKIHDLSTCIIIRNMYNEIEKKMIIRNQLNWSVSMWRVIK